MRAIDLLKTEHGRNYLMSEFRIQNVNNSPGFDRLSLEVVNYDKDSVYPISNSSYKDYFKSHRKVISPSLHAAISTTTCSVTIRTFLLDKYYDFNGDFFDINNSGEITFMPYNKLQEFTENYEFTSKGRQSIAIHKFVNKVIDKKKIGVTEHHVKCFSDELAAVTNESKFDVEILSGDDIAQTYNGVNCAYWNDGSCMSGRDTDTFKVYSDNPDTCNLVVVKYDGEVVGRALRWKTDQHGWVNDRFYAKTEIVRAYYRKWCTENKHIRKLRDNSDIEGEFVRHDSSIISEELVVQLVDNVSDYCSLPYLDTFAGTCGGSYLRTAESSPYFLRSDGGGDMYWDECDDDDDDW